MAAQTPGPDVVGTNPDGSTQLGDIVVPTKPAPPPPAAGSGRPKDFIATIHAGGVIYSAWESFQIRRQIGDGISQFSFVAAEGAYGPNNQALKLGPTDPVEIWLGSQKVIQGTVTDRTTGFDAQTHQLVISGASITDNLVQSSIPLKPGTYSGSTIEQAARAVLAPHKVGLVLQNPLDIVSKPFQWLAIQPGESPAQFIDRIRGLRGLHVWDDADGNLVLGQGNPSEAPVADLVEGRNIKSLSGTLSNATAYGKFAAIGQSPGSDDNWPPRNPSASATNPGAPADRQKLLLAPHPADSQELATLVNHSQSESLWLQVNVTVTVVGWYKPDGSLWEPVRNVTLYSPMLFPNQSGRLPLGIQCIVWAQDPINGSTTTLTLVLPNALSHRTLSGVQDSSGDKFVGTAQATSTSSAKPDSPDTMVST